MMQENKYRSRTREAQEEAELAALLATVEAPTPEPEAPKLTAEEETFKKRYGDLRKHSQTLEAGLRKEVEDLRRQLEASAKQEIKFPKTEEEVAAWVERYPDVAKIVDTIAMKRADERFQELDSRQSRLEEQEHLANRREAYKLLLSFHPDFEDIKDSDDFQDWLQEQPVYIQDALLVNETDAIAAKRAVDLYKADKGIGKKKTVEPKTDDTRDAARLVKTSPGAQPSGDNTQGYYSESQVRKMTAREYEKVDAIVTEQMRNGTFIYDLTGAAR